MRFTFALACASATSVALLACSGDDSNSAQTPAATGATGGSGGNGSTGTGGTASAGGSGGAGGTLQADILDQLRDVPGVIDVVEQTSDINGYRFFLIDFDQPVDHQNPGGQHFTQRLALHHQDSTAPFVLAATGYYLYLPWQYLEEPAELLHANQLVVEQRYFSPSRPNPADWTLLNIEQAAADHHRIVQAFRPIYAAQWISTGASKGGMTSVYHRRFYPADVDGTVAYVAPHTGAIDDTRYIDFLNQVGTDPACRQSLKDFQREALLRRSAMLARMADQAIIQGVTYDLLGIEPAFESTVTYLPFTFWQYDGQNLCANIPPQSASDDQVWTFLDDIGQPIYSADPYVLAFEPYYWQAYTQLGTPGVDTAHIDDLLVYDWSTIDDLPSIALDPMFDPVPMQEMTTWLTTQGKGILFVYGERDPWSAAAFDLGAAQDSYKFEMPGGNHGSDIAGLLPADQQTALTALQNWTGVVPTFPIQWTPPKPLPPPVRGFRRAGFH